MHNNFLRNNIIKNYNNNFLFSIFIIFVPLLFTFTIDLIFQERINEINKPLNRVNIIFEEKIIDKKTIKFNSEIDKPIIYNSFYSKFDEIISNYKKDLLRKKHSQKDNFLSNVNYLINNIKDDKKRNFIKKILPSISNYNKIILAERRQLIQIRDYLNVHKTLLKKDQQFLENLANKYSVSIKNTHKIDIIDNLMSNVDIIPNSIVLAQAANESGWGASRFAKDYNAFFGQYTYDSNLGVVPAERPIGKKHLIKYFSSIDESVQSYFYNINTHHAYKEFRELRKKLRQEGLSLDIKLLLSKLDSYAEDKNYIKSINSIISKNKLQKLDNIDYFMSL
tara:strand:+ start:1807 stop:2814 length:1008 start_codon:yes stop_codon:yes gene_type:complete